MAISLNRIIWCAEVRLGYVFWLSFWELYLGRILLNALDNSTRVMYSFGRAACWHEE